MRPCLKTFFHAPHCWLRFLPGLMALLCLQRAAASDAIYVDLQMPRPGDHTLWFYGSELSALPYPSDYTDTGPYAYYDRWCDDWNVSTEGSTTDTARSLAGIAWLGAQTSLADQPWRWTNATIIAP